MPVVLKEEEKEVKVIELLGDEEQDDGHDDGDLVPLGVAQWKRLKYPPSCPVVYISSQEAFPENLDDTVEAAFLHFETHKISYKLRQSGLVVPEFQLQFGRGALVWVIPPGETDSVPAVVLHVRVCRFGDDSDVLYSVQTEEGSKTIHHFVPSDSITYRSDDSARPAPPASSKSLEANRQLPGQSSAAASSGQHEPEETEFSGGYRRDSDRDVNDSRTGRVSESSNDPESPEPARKRGRDLTLTSQDMAESSNPRAVKRQRRSHEDRGDYEIVLQSLVLPKWFPVEQIKDHFSYANKVDLEKTTGCRLSLRGKAVEKDPPKPCRLYVTIEGRRDATDHAVELIEEKLLDSNTEVNFRCVFMHDLARDNPRYKRDGQFLYQRSGFHNAEKCQWQTCQDFPKGWSRDRGKRLLLGQNHHQGISEMIGSGSTVRVCGSPRPCVIICGKSLEAAKKCHERVVRRVEWAKSVYDRST